MRVFILPLLVLSSGCQFMAEEQDEVPTCLTEKFDLTRDQRRRGFLLREEMTNIEFGKDYTRRELIARYRLFLSSSNRENPTPEELSVAGKLVSQRSGGAYDPEEMITTVPCMYIEVIPATA